MGGTFVITLREGFEAALILGIVYTYLQKIGAQRHYRYATRGGLLGVLASIALGVVVTALSSPSLMTSSAARTSSLPTLRSRYSRSARQMSWRRRRSSVATSVGPSPWAKRVWA